MCVSCSNNLFDCATVERRYISSFRPHNNPNFNKSRYPSRHPALATGNRPWSPMLSRRPGWAAVAQTRYVGPGPPAHRRRRRHHPRRRRRVVPALELRCQRDSALARRLFIGTLRTCSRELRARAAGAPAPRRKRAVFQRCRLNRRAARDWRRQQSC